MGGPVNLVRLGVLAGVLFGALTWPSTAQAQEGITLEPEPGPEPMPDSTGVSVQFTADDPNAVLEVHSEDAVSSEAWTTVCVAPCRKQLDPSYAYRVGGDKIYSSDAFYLPEGRQRLSLRAETATKSGRMWAAIFAVGGGIVAANGLGLMLYGVILNSFDDNNVDEFDQTVVPNGTPYIIAGGIVFAAGATAGIIGLVKLVGHDTTVEISKNQLRPPRLRLASGLELSARGLHF